MCWNNNLFNQMIAGVLRLGLMRLLISEKGKKLLAKCMKHKPEKGEETYLIVEAKGYHKEQLCQRRCILKAFSDYETTAKVTSTLVRIMLEKETTGVKFPFEITSLEEVLQIINEPEASGGYAPRKGDSTLTIYNTGKHPEQAEKQYKEKLT